MKNLDIAIKKAAQELDIPVDQAKVVVNAFWERVYKDLIGGKNVTTTVRHIGSFTISRKKLYLNIRKRIGKIRNYRTTTRFTEETKALYIEREMHNLRRALVHRNTLAIQYAKIFGNI